MIDLLLALIGAEDMLRRKCLEEWRWSRAIRSKCALGSPGDFRLMNTCEEQQLKALPPLGR